MNDPKREVFKRSSTDRDVKSESKRTERAFRSLLDEYHDVCEKIASARESASNKEYTDELLERRRANLEQKLLRTLKSNRRL